ncbi:MAG: metal ABC transporter substrate-binding protein [Pseudomonadota bacterium]
MICLAAWVAFGASAQADDQPRIVTVNYPLQYFAERLVGDAAEVVYPVPAGVDPSFWRPSIADISAVQSADLILLSGAGFATWIDRVSLPRSRLVNTAAGYRDRFIATETITHSHGDGGEHSHEGIATYTWLDPTLALAQAEAVAAAIAGRGIADPTQVYAEFATLRADLEALDADARAALAGAQDVVFIATHPRYQYLAQAYGLTIVSLEWEAGTAPTQDQLDDLAARVASDGARILIWEAEPPQDAKDAAAALGLVNVTVPPLAQPVDAGFAASFRASVAALADAAAEFHSQ